MNCRAAVALVLLLLLLPEILPCFDRNGVLTEPGAGCGCRFEPLQACDHGDSFLGALANSPFVVLGIPALVFLPEVLRHVPDRASFVPDGFKPAIDHPPRHSAGMEPTITAMTPNHTNGGTRF